MRSQRDAEQLAELTIEIPKPGRRMAERGDHEFVLPPQALGEQPQHHTLATAGIAGDEGEAALAQQAMFDAPAEAVNLTADQQRLGGHFRRERIPFESIEREQLLVHDGGSSSGRYGGGNPVAANSANSFLSSGAISPAAGDAIAAAGFTMTRRR